MQSSCAHDVPRYSVQALRAREKRAVVLLHAFGLRSIVAGWTWCAPTRGGRVVRDARMIVNAHHVSLACMQSFCAHHVPHYTAQALRARGKRAVVLPHAFGLRSIFAGWTWCATSMASAAEARTATTTMHSPTHWRLRKPLRRQRCTARARFTRPAWPRRALRSHHQRDSGETRFFNTTRADYKKSLGSLTTGYREGFPTLPTIVGLAIW
jgi:hypothetical protein